MSPEKETELPAVTNAISFPPALMEQMKEQMKNSSPMSISVSKEPWSEYTLEDGTVIRLRMVLVQARKVIGELDEKGNPKYIVQLSPLILIEPSSSQEVSI